MFKNGQRLTAPQFVIYYRPNALTTARLGLAVSKRVARRATVRNQLKRLLRETFRHHRALLPALDFVVLLKPEASVTGMRPLREALQRALLSIGNPSSNQRRASRP